MNKLAALTQFLIGLNLVAPEQVDAWAEDMTLSLRYDPRGDGGTVLFERWYTAWLIFERWPHRHIDPDLLFAHVATWMIAHDPDRDRDRDEPDPQIDVEILDGDLADITLTIRFKEEVGIVPDTEGDIEYDGQRWRLETPTIWAAETGEVA